MKTNIKLAAATKLYHFTQESNVPSILENGLNTYKRVGFCGYEGDRVFLWVELFTPAIDCTLSLLLDERGGIDKYVLLEIDPLYLDKSAMFNDEDIAGHLAVWTDQAVPKEAIKVKGNLFDFM